MIILLILGIVALVGTSAPKRYPEQKPEPEKEVDALVNMISCIPKGDVKPIAEYGIVYDAGNSAQ